MSKALLSLILPSTPKLLKFQCIAFQSESYELKADS